MDGLKSLFSDSHIFLILKMTEIDFNCSTFQNKKSWKEAGLILGGDGMHSNNYQPDSFHHINTLNHYISFSLLSR